jgi:thioredoxin 1
VADDLREFTEATLRAELERPGPPVLVDCFAPWCGSCRFLAPAVEQLAAEYAGSLRVGKLDVDASPDFARAHDVHSVPTLLLFVDGEPVLRITGVKKKAALVEELAPYLTSPGEDGDVAAAATRRR